MDSDPFKQDKGKGPISGIKGLSEIKGSPKRVGSGGGFLVQGNQEGLRVVPAKPSALKGTQNASREALGSLSEPNLGPGSVNYWPDRDGSRLESAGGVAITSRFGDVANSPVEEALWPVSTFLNAIEELRQSAPRLGGQLEQGRGFPIIHTLSLVPHIVDRVLEGPGAHAARGDGGSLREPLTILVQESLNVGLVSGGTAKHRLPVLSKRPSAVAFANRKIPVGIPQHPCRGYGGFDPFGSGRVVLDTLEPLMGPSVLLLQKTLLEGGLKLGDGGTPPVAPDVVSDAPLRGVHAEVPEQLARDLTAPKSAGVRFVEATDDASEATLMQVLPMTDISRGRLEPGGKTARVRAGFAGEEAGGLEGGFSIAGPRSPDGVDLAGLEEAVPLGLRSGDPFPFSFQGGGGLSWERFLRSASFPSRGVAFGPRNGQSGSSDRMVGERSMGDDAARTEASRSPDRVRGGGAGDVPAHGDETGSEATHGLREDPVVGIGVEVRAQNPGGDRESLCDFREDVDPGTRPTVGGHQGDRYAGPMQSGG